MADRVVLHIGLMKSGTTFLQGRLGANRDELAGQGVLFPRPPWPRQVQAVKELAGNADAPAGSWDDLAEEIRAHDGTAVVSMEFLAPIPAARLARLSEDFPGARVEAVVTVRDLGRTVPAMWQEAMQNRRSWSWQEYVESVRTGEGEAGKTFWRQQGAGRIVETWCEVLGRDAVSVVTVPPKGGPPELLWERFCEVAQIAPAQWAQAQRNNESLGLASALMMGRLNALVGDADRATYNKRVKRMAKTVLAQRMGVEDSLGFTVPPWLHERARGRNERMAETGVRIVGDLKELEPIDVPGTDPATVSADEQLEAALDLLAAFIKQPPGGGGRKPAKGSRSRRA